MDISPCKILFPALFLFFILSGQYVHAKDWKAKWITALENQNATNTWISFRKDFTINTPPAKAIACIAADSKYWLWINGKQVVFEGGLKRGPNPHDTYFDEIDIAPYLVKGENSVAILLWYFGKDGFSHNSSGKAALLFDCQAHGFSLLSNKNWKAVIDSAYQTCASPLPNFRLAESSILYNAHLEKSGWEQPDFNGGWMQPASEVGKAGDAPWNNLVLRPIPFWKDYGLKKYVKIYLRQDKKNHRDTIIGYLPYDAQVTPYIELEAPANKQIDIFTDNYLIYNGGAEGIRSGYVTKQGYQIYESLGWMNGHKVYYIIPEGVKVRSVQFRETGYDTGFAGSFSCSDILLSRLWQKAARTLYLNMRDNFMDCPERERAQWTGDAVIESGQTFYALSRSSDLLIKKWMHEIAGWQRADSSMISPVPEGNYATELPDQILATVGYYGIWNYYLNSGDKQTIEDLYPAIKKYLSLWKTAKKGTVELRKGDWTWGDWGENKDMLLIYNLWYYLAVKSQYLVATELHYDGDAKQDLLFMKRFKIAFNNQFWDTKLKAYRDTAYKGNTDDRAQALAVVSGIAGIDKFAPLLRVFENEMHASPYMEKYVFEAMMQMGYPDQAIKRQELRYSDMVNNPVFTTLFEGWGIGRDGFGGGTVNHAWSGGGLTVLSQYLCGVSPLEPGYKEFQILPLPGAVKYANTVVPSEQGKIYSAFKNTKDYFELDCIIPPHTEAIAGIPARKYNEITVNGKTVWKISAYTGDAGAFHPVNAAGYFKFSVPSGNYVIKGIYK